MSARSDRWKTQRHNGLTPTEPNATAAGFVINKDLKAFEAVLRIRSDRPADSVVELMSVDAKEVRHAASSVTQTLKRFARAIVDSMDNPASINDFLRELDLKLIAKDHDWREIFAAISDKDTSYEPHKRVLVIKYLQYLSTRKRLLAHVLSRRSSLEDTGNHSRFSPGSHTSVDQDMGGMLETADLGVLIPKNYERLQMGESVQLDLPEGSSFEIMLAKHVYRLSGSDTPQLTAPDGTAYALNEGRSMVGRHPECDIVSDRNYRDVSRVHIIIEWTGEPWIKVTDLSTLGTFVPTKMISS